MNLGNKEKILKEVENNQLELDSEFMFGCNKCGKCCRNDIDIVLNAYDMYRLAGFLNIKTEDVIDRYCNLIIGKESRLPVAWLRFNTGRCPFLKNNGCSVHEVKPFVCACYPLGRGYDISNKKVVYFLQEIHCGKKNCKHTVKQWIYGNSDAEIEEAIFMKWSEILNLLVPFMRSADKFVPQVLAELMLNVLYVGYDTRQPFLPQLNERKKQVEKIIADVKGILAM